MQNEKCKMQIEEYRSQIGGKRHRNKPICTLHFTFFILHSSAMRPVLSARGGVAQR
jgi:hypothetical protein